jgi:crossover junction endodeoxyribonuclease RusA
VLKPQDLQQEVRMSDIMYFSFIVYGVPVPQGSMRAFVPKGWKRAVITSANSKTKPWRQEVAGACLNRLNGSTPAGRSIPVRIGIDFFFDRPKSVKKLADKVTKPDIDKLARSILDALTGIAFEDDCQVTDLHVTKQFGSPARAEIVISEALPPQIPLLHAPIKNKDIPF